MSDLTKVLTAVNKICDTIRVPHVTAIRKGVVTCETSCALANTFWECDGVTRVTVDNSYIAIYRRLNPDDEKPTMFMIDTPSVLKQFIDDFDNGRYPELVNEYDEED